MKAMAYKYETHLHTSEASACASSPAADYIEAFYKAGYSGIFVTDHFFGGNTCVSNELDWKSRVDLYCKGYENALAQAEIFNQKNKLKGSDKEFKVFFGLEQTFQGDDYLVYGLNKEWLINHPQVETMNHMQLFEAVNQENGLMIQAHPFRLRGYMQAIHLHPREVHGVEVYNAGNKPSENQLAELYAKEYDFPVTSGSDIHTINKIGDPSSLPLGGMDFEEPLKSIEDYINNIKNRKGILIK